MSTIGPGGRLQGAALQDPERAHGVPLALGERRRETALPDEGEQAGHLRRRVEIGGGVFAAVDRRTQHAGVQHSGRPHVLDKGGPAGELGGNVDALEALADKTPARDRDAGRVRRRGDVQIEPGGQRPVGDRASVLRAQKPLVGQNLAFADAPARRRRLSEKTAHIGGGVDDGRSAVLHGMAAGGNSLIRRTRGVGRDEREGVQLDVEFLGRELKYRGL